MEPTSIGVCSGSNVADIQLGDEAGGEVTREQRRRCVLEMDLGLDHRYDH